MLSMWKGPIDRADLKMRLPYAQEYPNYELSVGHPTSMAQISPRLEAQTLGYGFPWFCVRIIRSACGGFSTNLVPVWSVP
jgi:hypothetical protein